MPTSGALRHVAPGMMHATRSSEAVMAALSPIFISIGDLRKRNPSREDDRLDDAGHRARVLDLAIAEIADGHCDAPPVG